MLPSIWRRNNVYDLRGMHRIIEDVLVQSFCVMNVKKEVPKLSSLYLNLQLSKLFLFPVLKNLIPVWNMGKMWVLCQCPAHLYWKVSGKESCCVQGTPCCHLILSAVSFTACLTCIVLAFVKEQLHRCDYSVFVPISC